MPVFGEICQSYKCVKGPYILFCIILFSFPEEKSHEFCYIIWEFVADKDLSPSEMEEIGGQHPSGASRAATATDIDTLGLIKVKQ